MVPDTSDEQSNVVYFPGSRGFITQIGSLVRSGYGFVPLIGSGMSAPSGILMGQSFTEFLALAVYGVLSRESEQNQKRLRIREQGWPRYPRYTDTEDVVAWVKKEYERICQRYEYAVQFSGRYVVDIQYVGNVSLRENSSQTLYSVLNRPLIPQLLLGPSMLQQERIARSVIRSVHGDISMNHPVGGVRPGFSTSSSDYIIEMGIRSLHDWRATLNFLATVDLDGERLVLREKDESVIDRFNSHIVRGRQCNLGHKMIAHLARPMRFRTLLYAFQFESARIPLRSPSLPMITPPS